MSKYELAFPTVEANGVNFGEPRMTLHQYYMAHAPFTMEDASAYARDTKGDYRWVLEYGEIMQAMKQLRLEYADAMCGISEDEASND